MDKRDWNQIRANSKRFCRSNWDQIYKEAVCLSTPLHVTQKMIYMVVYTKSIGKQVEAHLLQYEIYMMDVDRLHQLIGLQKIIQQEWINMKIQLKKWKC